MKVHEVQILWKYRNNTNLLTVLELWMIVVGLVTERSD